MRDHRSATTARARGDAAPVTFAVRAASAAVVAVALTAGCDSEETPPTKTIHVYNPFVEQGLQPLFHGEVNGWGKGAMSDEGCGWFSYPTTDAAPGPFRFLGGDWGGPEWGTSGLGTGLDNANFVVDDLLSASDDVYLAPDTATGFTERSTSKPFECTPTTVAPLVNPFGRGALPTLARASHVDELLGVWLANYYEEQGDLARVRFDDPSLTVSEGIGYGMLILVAVDSGAGEQRARFDRLWAYYQRFADENGLMHWRVQGFDAVVGTGSASDADVDVATALVLANGRWEAGVRSAPYGAAAATLAAAIRAHELDAAGRLLPGDAWTAAYNPSYLSPVAFELFAAYDAAGASTWATATAANYDLLDAARSPAGLYPNWSSADGAPIDPGNGYVNWAAHGFDAIRVPWRMGWAHLWFGDRAAHARAGGHATSACSFIVGQTGGDPSLVRPEYGLDGTPQGVTQAGPGAMGTWATACAAAGQVTPLDALYSTMQGQTATYDVTYYQTTLKLLATLLLTGRMTAPAGL